MPGDRRPPAWLPWALFWASVALVLPGGGARIALPEGPEDAAVPVGLSVLVCVLVARVGALNPARRRVQAAVDRRFDRGRHDAIRAVDAFAARLRDSVDLDQVTSGLRDTVAVTVVPAPVGVWLRGAAPGPAGSGP